MPTPYYPEKINSSSEYDIFNAVAVSLPGIGGKTAVLNSNHSPSYTDGSPTRVNVDTSSYYGTSGSGCYSLQSATAYTFGPLLLVDSTGQRHDADSLPSAKFYVNGNDSSLSITVNDVGSGLYNFSFTTPSATTGSYWKLISYFTMDTIESHADVASGFFG